MTDLKHLPEKIKKHEQSAKHMNNMIDLSLLGRVNIAEQLDTAYKLSIARHNEQVRKNRDVLSKIINCVKFCGKFELSLRGYDETMSSKNPGVFRILIDCACELDSTLEAHFKTATVFKGTSKSIQNELLESMLKVCKSKIKEEIKNVDYLAVMCDETTDVYDKHRWLLFYDMKCKESLIERLWGFFNPINQTAEALLSVLLEELHTLISNCPYKLIAQTYDGEAALSGINNGLT